MAIRFSFTFQFIVTFYFLLFFSLPYLPYYSCYVMSAVQSSDLSCLISKRNDARRLINPHIPIHITITSNLRNSNRKLNSRCQNLAQEPVAAGASTVHWILHHHLLEDRGNIIANWKLYDISFLPFLFVFVLSVPSTPWLLAWLVAKRLSSRLPSSLFFSFHFTHLFPLKLACEFGCAAISDWLSFIVFLH